MCHIQALRQVIVDTSYVHIFVADSLPTAFTVKAYGVMLDTHDFENL